MADKWTPELLLFRQVDRVNRTISGDLNEATFESFEDYMHKVRNSVMALEAMLAEEMEDDDEYSRPSLEVDNEFNVDHTTYFNHIMNRYEAALQVIQRNNILGTEEMHIEEPI